MAKKQFIGFDLFPWQADVHKGLLEHGLGSGHIHVVKSKRQVGKSLLIIGELLYFSINYPKTVNGCISPTLNQARKIYKDILNAIEDSGIVLKKNDSLLQIELINKSTILFKSAEQRESLRGYTYTGLLCIDEAAYINDEIFSIVKPSTDVWRCPVLITSTPKFRIGFFFELFTKGQTGAKNITSYDFNSYDTSALLSKEALEMYRQMLPKNQYLTEYLGEFLDSDSSVFSGFKECVGSGISEYGSLYIGIDWGSGTGSDYTVVTAINEYNEQVFLLAFNNKTTIQQIDYIAECLEPYKDKIKSIYAENNGLGKPLCDNLKARLPKFPITEWTTTNSNKIEMINRLQVAFEQKRITLLDDERQTAQLSMYECTYNMKSGNLTYNAPNGGNDDMVMALLIAFECKRNVNKTGQYSFLFV